MLTVRVERPKKTPVTPKTPNPCAMEAMAITSKITMKLGKMSPFARDLVRELEKRVAIGFPANSPGRQPEKGEEAPPSNALIA